MLPGGRLTTGIRGFISAISVLRFGSFVWAFAASSQTLTLPYRPVTAEYSNALDRIVFIAANPNQLHIFDPAANTDTAVNLPKPPLSLSVSLDGRHAAVGHDALISYVNLLTASLERTLPANVTVTSLVLGNDYVYILTYSSGTEWIQISTGATGANGVYGTTGRLHPSGKAIYTTDDGTFPENLQDLNVSTGPVTNAAQGPYWGDYPVCGGVWFSPDGRRTYTGCATAYQAAPSDTSLNCCSVSLDTSADGLYWASFAGTSLIRSLTESAALGRIAVIPFSNQFATTTVNDNQVFLYNSDFLEPTGIFQLPDFVVNGKSFQAHGQQLFFNSNSTALYVVMQADSSSGLLNNFAVQVFSPADSQSCVPTFSTTSTMLAASGTISTVGITAPASCIYQASSNSSWIQLISGAYGSGNGTITFIVRPNSGAQRIGDIMLGGQSFAITQLGVSTPLSTLTPLGYSVTGADYSKALDKLVLIVSQPKELHIYDPVAGSDEIVALPKPPFFVSVSPDGLSAAVGMDGCITLVNLANATITSTIQVFTDVHTILLGGHGYVYVYPLRRDNLYSVSIANGAIDYASEIFNGRYPRLYADGNTFYTETSKWNIANGPAALINENFSGGCAPIWLTEDGNREITSCGKAYTTSPVPSLDLQYNGSFSNATSIQWAAESIRWHSTAIVPSAGSASDNSGDTYLQIYGDAYLGYAGSLSLPMFTVGSTQYAGRGRYVFWNKLEDKLIVLEQADSTANLTADYAATVYPLTTLPPGCSYSLGANSASFDLTGGLNIASVTTGVACTWNAVSGASWITVNSGAIGFGSNTVAYTVAPNTGAGSRTGSLMIAGEIFTITQSGSPVISVTPAFGSGSAQTFALTVADSNGAGNIAGTWFLVNSSLSSVHGCGVQFNRAANTFELMNDAGSGWLGPITLGTANSLSNSQCTVSANSASTSTSGSNLTVNIPLYFPSGFNGAQNTYGNVFDNAGPNSGWITTGSWTVPASGPPAPISVAPASGSGSVQTFALTVADSNGAGNIAGTWFLVNSSLSSVHGCGVQFNRAANTFELMNDAGSGWLGPITLGTANSISNSQCTVSGNSASTSTSGSNLTVNIPLYFPSGFNGAQNTYGNVFDNAGPSSGWITTGSWIVPASGPPAPISVAPASGSGSAQTFALTVADSNGAGNIAGTWFLVNSSLSSVHGCGVQFNRAANTFELMNDAGTGWLGPITLGTANSLSNSQCTVSANSASASTSGSNLTVNIPLYFPSGFNGAQNTYGNVFDNAGPNSGWITTGSWTVPASGPPAVGSAIWTGNKTR
jgi:hypothetical protein